MLKANRLVALQKSQVARKRVIPFTQTTIVAMLHTTFLGGGEGGMFKWGHLISSYHSL